MMIRCFKSVVFDFFVHSIAGYCTDLELFMEVEDLLKKNPTYLVLFAGLLKEFSSQFWNWNLTSFIHWPNAEERAEISLRFAREHGLEGTVGILDGTSVIFSKRTGDWWSRRVEKEDDQDVTLLLQDHI
jgi:hypothetical protein